MAIVLTRGNLNRALQAAAATTGGAMVSPAVGPDDPVTALAKLVPGEAVALYTALVAIPADGAAAKFAPLVAFVLGAALTAYLPWRDGQRHRPPVRPEAAQYVLQLFAFAAWSLSIHDCLAPLGLVIPHWILAFAVVAIPVAGGLSMGSTQPQTTAAWP